MKNRRRGAPRGGRVDRKTRATPRKRGIVFAPSRRSAPLGGGKKEIGSARAVKAWASEALATSSSPDLIRRSIFLAKRMDARVKPAHDEKGKLAV
jgi:hypothetical protein